MLKQTNYIYRNVEVGSLINKSEAGNRSRCRIRLNRWY